MAAVWAAGPDPIIVTLWWTILLFVVVVDAEFRLKLSKSEIESEADLEFFRLRRTMLWENRRVQLRVCKNVWRGPENMQWIRSKMEVEKMNGDYRFYMARLDFFFRLAPSQFSFSAHSINNKNDLEVLNLPQVRPR